MSDESSEGRNSTTEAPKGPDKLTPVQQLWNAVKGGANDGVGPKTETIDIINVATDEKQTLTTETPIVADKLTHSQQFQTTAEKLLIYYKPRKPTYDKGKLISPRYTSTGDKEELVLREPDGGGKMGIREWIEKDLNGEFKWGITQPLGSISSGEPIFWTDTIVTKGDEVVHEVVDEASDRRYKETHLMSDPKTSKLVEMKLREATKNLSSYLPQTQTATV